MPDPLSTKDELDLYENGKHRRYSLLFAVNGGAFAIAKLVGEGRDLGVLSLSLLSLGMIVFTMIMTLDIYAFGFWCKKRFVESVFGRIGQVVLGSIGSLICAGWMLVIFRDSRDSYGNTAIGMLIVLLVGGALISGVHEYVSSQFKKDKPAEEGPMSQSPTE